MNKILFSAYLPTDLIETVQPWLDYVFMEPVDDERYISFYREYLCEFKLLDNGLCEYGESWQPTDLDRYAREVRPTHVIPPDRLGEWFHNLHQLKQMITGRYRLLPCLAGPFETDFKLQMAESSYPQVNGYCLPYRLARHPLGRYHSHEHVHLLGLKWPEPYHLYTRSGAIVSLDTTEPINATFECKEYAEEGFTTTRRHPYYKDLKISDVSIHLLKANIDWLKAKLNEGVSE